MSFSPAGITTRQKSFALVVLVVALVLEIVDITIVNTALPAIQRGIGADPVHAQWIVAGYSLAFALLLMAGGRLGDSYGYRRMFVCGVIGFTLSSLACGLSRSGGELVSARLLQGATGAVMAPQSMALLQVLFEPLERVSKLALFGVIGGLAAIAGPILGGMLIDANVLGLGWRLVFLINLPVGVVAIAGGLRYLPAARSDIHRGFDFLGLIFFGAAVAALLWPLMAIEEGGWSLVAIVSFAATAPLFWLGWRHVAGKVKASRPALFDPCILRVDTFRLGLLMSIAFAAANGGFLLIFAFALQAERGQTPLVTGLLHMPFGFGAMLGIGVLSRKLLPKYGKLIPTLGALLMALSSALVLLVIGGGAALWLAVPAMVGAGIGMGMTTGCIGPITFSHMDRAHAGAASGLLKTCQQLGAALGVALAGSAYFGWAKWTGGTPSVVAAPVIVALLLACAACGQRLPGAIFDAPQR